MDSTLEHRQKKFATRLNFIASKSQLHLDKDSTRLRETYVLLGVSIWIEQKGTLSVKLTFPHGSSQFFFFLLRIIVNTKIRFTLICCNLRQWKIKGRKSSNVDKFWCNLFCHFICRPVHTHNENQLIMS